MAGKKEFKWDKEELVSTEIISEHEKREARICEFKGKEFVVFTTLKYIKNAWLPCSGYSIPKEIWSSIVEAVNKTLKGGKK